MNRFFFFCKYCKTLIAGLFDFFSCDVFFCAFFINMPKLNYKKIEGLFVQVYWTRKSKQIPLGTDLQSLYVQTDIAISAGIP